MPVKKKQPKKAKIVVKRNTKAKAVPKTKQSTNIQNVSQKVNVIVGSQQAKRKGTSKPKTKIEYVPFGGGGGGGVAPFDPSTYAVYKLPPEGNKFPYPYQKPETPLLQNLQTARLTYKGDNPPLEVSGLVAKKMLNRLEKQSNLSNEDTETVIKELPQDYDEKLKEEGIQEERRRERQKRSEASKRGAETRRKKKQPAAPVKIEFDTTPSETELELAPMPKKTFFKPYLSRAEVDQLENELDLNFRKGGVISQFTFSGYQ